MTQSEPVALPELPEPDVSGFPSKDDPDEFLAYSSDAMKAFGFQCYARGVMAGRTTPVLTDEQILEIARATDAGDFSGDKAAFIQFARAILAATKQGADKE